MKHSQNTSVAATSTLILPAVNPASFTDYSVEDDWPGVTAHAVGDYVRVIENGRPKYYVCITAGDTDATYPTWTTGDVTSDGAVFRYINPQRNGIALTNSGSANVWIAFGEAAILALLLAINGGCTSVTNVFYGDVEVSPDVIMGK